MKRFLIILSILALLIGCAAKKNEAENKQPRDSEIVKDIGTRGQQ